MSTTANEQEKLLTYEEAADALHVPVGTLYALVSRGEVPHVRLAKRIVRFRAGELASWVEQHAHPVAEPKRGAL